MLMSAYRGAKPYHCLEYRRFDPWDKEKPLSSFQALPLEPFEPSERLTKVSTLIDPSDQRADKGI